MNNPDNELDIKLTKQFLIAWLRETKVVHPVAWWCWQILQYVYKDNEVMSP